jgi:hypothetical protein
VVAIILSRVRNPGVTRLTSHCPASYVIRVAYALNTIQAHYLGSGQSMMVRQLMQRTVCTHLVLDNNNNNSHTDNNNDHYAQYMREVTHTLSHSYHNKLRRN